MINNQSCMDVHNMAAITFGTLCFRTTCYALFLVKKLSPGTSVLSWFSSQVPPIKALAICFWQQISLRWQRLPRLLASSKSTSPNSVSHSRLHCSNKTRCSSVLTAHSMMGWKSTGCGAVYQTKIQSHQCGTIECTCQVVSLLHVCQSFWHLTAQTLCFVQWSLNPEIPEI